jgi:hypothetical protein
MTVLALLILFSAGVVRAAPPAVVRDQLTLLPTSSELSGSADINPYPYKSRLVFRPDGTFKITVFSDLHFGEKPWEDWGPEHDANSVKLMRTVLAEEAMDYVYVHRAWSA